MNSTSEHIAIKTGYEVNGMTIEEIAEDRDMEIAVVKAALAQSSSKYRKEVGLSSSTIDVGLDFTDDELEAVNREIFKLAMYSEDEHVKTKNLHYIRDDKKGRKEVVKQVANQTFNLLQFNDSIARVREQAEKAKGRFIDA